MRLLVYTDIPNLSEELTFSNNLEIDYYCISSPSVLGKYTWFVHYTHNSHIVPDHLKRLATFYVRCYPSKGHWYPQWKAEWETKVKYKCICYKKSKNRRETSAEIKKNIPDLEIIDAFDGVHFTEEVVHFAREHNLINPDVLLKTPGEIGCYTSHTYSWKKAYSDYSHGWLFICEDDCACLENQASIEGILKLVSEKSSESEIVYFYLDPRYGIAIEKRKQWLEKPDYQKDIQSYLQNNEAYLFLGNTSFVPKGPEDHILVKNLPQVGFVAYAIKVNRIPFLLEKIKANRVCALDYALMHTVFPLNGIVNEANNKVYNPTHTITVFPSVFKNLGDRYYGDSGQHALANGNVVIDENKKKFSSIICPEEKKKFYETAKIEDRMKAKPLKLSDISEDWY